MTINSAAKRNHDALVGEPRLHPRADRPELIEYGETVPGQIVGDQAVEGRLTDTRAEELHFQRYLAAAP